MIMPYESWFYMLANPTIPKFYWNVKSQEQLIKEICKHIKGIIDYCDEQSAQINANTAAIAELQDAFKKFMESGFDDYYYEQIHQWVIDHMADIFTDFIDVALMPGLTEDGYFCIYKPANWRSVTFDTVADYSSPDYGKLTLTY